MACIIVWICVGKGLSNFYPSFYLTTLTLANARVAAEPLRCRPQPEARALPAAGVTPGASGPRRAGTVNGSSPTGTRVTTTAVMAVGMTAGRGQEPEVEDPLKEEVGRRSRERRRGGVPGRGPPPRPQREEAHHRRRSRLPGLLGEATTSRADQRARIGTVTEVNRLPLQRRPWEEDPSRSLSGESNNQRLPL